MSLPRTPSFSLTGRRALIAGGSSGIGLGCACALAEAGAHVIVAARGAERVNAAVAQMKAEGFSAEAVILDIEDIEAIKRTLAETGPLDILINSAGTARHSPALETGFADYEAVMNANVRGAYFLATEAARGMVAAGKRGSIITVSSQMAHVGGVDRAVYCASKHAVEGFTKAMAIEWGPHGIRVNTICPTFIVTPLTKQTFDRPERRAWVEEKIKLGRVGEVEDIMGAAVYLASDASALVTGSSLLIDGGWTAD